ncbi:MAG: tryptophan synthase subunit alpha [Planctomycetes bacterium RBG_16_64_10]|nr:MAG: tryptophan synthase subunit alpha [Planctomycetes bacterium RBG_16_64_10]
MSALDDLFGTLRARGRKALMPFVTAGDPDLDFTAAVLRELVRRGSSLCEVGIPYSDPIADGPVVQASYCRALDRGFRLAQGLQMIADVAPGLGAPLVTMVSYATVHRWGVHRYVTEAKAAGVAGAIVPDLPVDEAGALAAICRQADLSLIQLVTPTTPRARALRIAELATGFLYYVTVTGTTGERDALPPALVDDVAWLRARSHLPVCVGFGISQPAHARALAPVADGLIVGSAIVRRIARAVDGPRDAVLREVGDFAVSLLEAMAS